MCNLRVLTVVSGVLWFSLIAIFGAQFSTHKLFVFELGNPGAYVVVQLIALFYNGIIFLLLERIRSLNARSSPEVYVCLTFTTGLLGSICIFVFSWSLLDVPKLFLQVPYFALVSAINSLFLMLSSCCEQIEYDATIREIINEYESAKYRSNSVVVTYETKQNSIEESTQLPCTNSTVLNINNLNEKQTNDEHLQLHTRYATTSTDTTKLFDITENRSSDSDDSEELPEVVVKTHSQNGLNTTWSTSNKPNENFSRY
ncbi:hypothetical protein M3Y94_01117600 [Aphelenchoides besseyi]|nr:hypothetical protein M3Y94_01117600 [Aphelenchoides besseyi]KAI6219224.1 hypothetical protein M3Y95_01116700 [Aphelenchoides besseyi]